MGTTALALLLTGYLMVTTGVWVRAREAAKELEAEGLDAPRPKYAAISCWCWPFLLGYSIARLIDTPSAYELEMAALRRELKQ